jgi:hypothetical protein
MCTPDLVGQKRGHTPVYLRDIFWDLIICDDLLDQISLEGLSRAST